MSTITKERVAQFIKNPLDNGLTRGEQMELARIALASLEAEPVHQVLTGDAWVDLSKGAMESQKRVGAIVRTVYTAHPAPLSVPDAVDYSDLDPTSKDREIIEAIAECKGWNACRAAMLQGAEPSKMSGIMPDYEGGVMTQREFFQAGWEAHHAAMLRAGAPVQFGWSKGHFGYHTLFNAIGKAVNIQGNALSISVSAFEDAMLAAVPQQEVKNG